MQTFDLAPDPLDQNLHFNKTPRCVTSMFKFEKCCSGTADLKILPPPPPPASGKWKVCLRRGP